MQPMDPQAYAAEPYRAWFPRYENKTDSGIERARESAQTHLRVGQVRYVDTEHFLADIALNEGGMIHVSTMVSADSSKASDAGTFPCIGSYVLVGMVHQLGSIEDWVLIGTIKSGYRSGQALMATKEHPETPENDPVQRQISRKIDSAEYQIMAEKGGEALFDEGWSMLSKDLASVKVDFATETQVANLHNYMTQSFGGRVQAGAAVRLLTDQSGVYAHPTGLSFQYVTPDGLDPALRYKQGSTPGLVATEEVHVYHELTDLVPDPTPFVEGMHAGHATDLNKISSFSGSDPTWKMTSDCPPDTQQIILPVDENSHRENHPTQTLYQSDAISIQHRRDLRYTHDSNLVGAFETDTKRYLSVLVPQIMFNKFETNFAHDHQTLKDPHPHTKFRLRVPVRAEYSPLIYNQTAYYQTKEGYQQWVWGATLPADGHPITNAQAHYKGAGRSGELFTFGGLEAVLGKTQDEEESLSLTTMGQIFAHIGADDGTKPHANRQIQGLNKITGQMEALDVYNWDTLLTPGGNLNYHLKECAENISMVLTTDGGISGRFGAREATVGRKFVYNGFDAKGRTQGGFPNSHNANRQVYGSGDAAYAFHTLSNATSSNASIDPCNLGADSMAAYDPDVHGRSWDFHLCGDMFLRVGKNPESGISWSMDSDGGLLWWLGQDNNGRSLVVETDGGVQFKIGAAKNGEAMNVNLSGNVNVTVDGTLTRTITGDLVEHVKGSRTVTVDGDDTIMIKGNFSPIFNNYTLLCNGKGVMGFGEGLNMSVNGEGFLTTVTGPTTTYLNGDQTTKLVGNKTTTVEGATTTSISKEVTFKAKAVSNTVSKSIVNNVPLVQDTQVHQVQGILEVDGGFDTSSGGAIPGTLKVQTDAIINGISFDGHTHPDAQGGSTGTPQ